MRVRYRDLALSDIDHIFRYRDERSPAGARKVIDAIRAAINDVAQNPLSSRRTSDPTVRVKVVNRYGYKIFYSVEDDAIEILHVRHGARRPWRAEESRGKPIKIQIALFGDRPSSSTACVALVNPPQRPAGRPCRASRP